MTRAESVGSDRRREFNEDRRRIFASSPGTIAFICECADSACYSTVALSAAQYDLARSRPPGLVLLPQHAPPRRRP